MELRYGIGEPRRHSLKQIGRRFGISAERVRQIETRALSRLVELDGSAAVAPQRAGRRPASPGPPLPGNVLQALSLLLLRGQPAHGYELNKRLQRSGFHISGARLYRLLRDLEQSDLVCSDWSQSGVGPERRVYTLTAEGSRQLQDDAQALRPLFDILEDFFAQYAHGPPRAGHMHHARG